MNLSELLQTLQVLALAAAVALLYRLVGEFRLLRNRLEADREKKDGQTINVNLSPVALPEAKDASALSLRRESEPIREEEPESEPRPEPPPIQSPGPVRITSGGLGAVKCPKCGAENSTYRSECFNCGAPLR